MDPNGNKHDSFFACGICLLVLINVEHVLQLAAPLLAQVKRVRRPANTCGMLAEHGRQRQ